MVKCDRCGVIAVRRVTRSDGMKVCKSCNEKIEYENYAALVALILNKPDTGGTYGA